MFEQKHDWLMRRIQMLAEFVARVIFRSNDSSYELNEEQAGEMGELYAKLRELLLTDNINDAEDTLYENFCDSEDYLRLAVWFYSEVNLMSDDELKAAGYSREEIYEGLQGVLTKSGVSLTGFM